jgi:cytochrome c
MSTRSGPKASWRRAVIAPAIGMAFMASLASATPAVAQSAPHGIGRAPTLEEIARWDIAVGPTGDELPEGRGSAIEGRRVYEARCVTCHGATGAEGPEDVLRGGIGSLATANPLKTVGSYWPYATTLWDYINRAMPFDRPTSLSNDEVYAVVAYVLFLNEIVPETHVLDRRSLLDVRMPNRDGFVPDPRPDASPPPTP